MDAEPKGQVKRLLAVVDSSVTSEAVVSYAIVLAQALHASVDFVYNVDVSKLEYLQKLLFLVPEEKSSIQKQLEEEGKNLLKQIRSRVEQETSLVMETYLLRGSTHQMVLQAGRELKSDMILIGGWEGGYASRDATASEWQMILDQAECPVLVVRPPASGKTL